MQMPRHFCGTCGQVSPTKLLLRLGFGKDRAGEGAGPVTIGMDIGYIKPVVSHAAAAHGVRVQAEPIDLARIALQRLGQ